MYFHFGNSEYGKVDVVPDLCHVATRFFHFNFIPLIPLYSEIVVTGTRGGDGVQRLKTRLSIKSVLVAWLRAGLYMTAIARAVTGFIMTIDHFGERRGPPGKFLIVVWGVVAASIVLIWLSHRWTRASYDRALQLGAELGLEPTLVEQYLTTSREDREAAARAAKEPEGWERYS